MKTLVVGAAIVDQMMMIDRLPLSGEDIPCRETKTVIGGCAFNVASTMRNIGASHDLCVPVGTGMYADLIQKGLKENGYPVLLHTDTMDNGYCLSLVENTGERTFITVVGAEGHFEKEWLDRIDLSEYGQIYLAGYQVAGASGQILADWLRDSKTSARVFFAPGPVITTISSKIMNELLSLHPILHINEKEAKDFTQNEHIETALHILYERTGAPVIVTLGSKGTSYFDGSGTKIIPSEPARVVDTVGAGDSHIGAVMSGLALGKSLEESIAVANRVAGAIVATQGPTMTKEDFDRKQIICFTA
ncbi:PfkB family carbohydrate kinase [Eubacteriales bacterium mix99]|jgi:sugar/nucleoside kinase (ribokinase family)